MKDDNVMMLVVMEVMRAPSEVFTAIETLARLLTILCHSMPKIRVFLIDAIFEQCASFWSSCQTTRSRTP